MDENVYNVAKVYILFSTSTRYTKNVSKVFYLIP